MGLAVGLGCGVQVGSGVQVGCIVGVGAGGGGSGTSLPAFEMPTIRMINETTPTAARNPVRTINLVLGRCSLKSFTVYLMSRWLVAICRSLMESTLIQKPWCLNAVMRSCNARRGNTPTS